MTPIEKYAARIGAEELNFKHYVVRQYLDEASKYYRDVANINIDKEGNINISFRGKAIDGYDPTDAEAAAIKEHYAANPPPKWLPVEERVLNNLKLDNPHYIFWDRKTDKVIMVQERMDFPDGKKAYVPHTFWSDGFWHRMEPDFESNPDWTGKGLPIWKPRHPTGKRKLMIHEGAKTASLVTDMCNDPECTHPWIEELREYESWGMIGGANAMYRTDYSSIHEFAPEELVYACDNDQAGQDAAVDVSKLYGKKMKCIRFDIKFPHKWDLADDMPEKHFNKVGVWIGGPLHSYMEPATWATEDVYDPKKDKWSLRCTPEFRAEWYHCPNEPEVYINKDFPNRFYTGEGFSRYITTFSDTYTTHKYLNRDLPNRVDCIQYHPGMPPGPCIVDGRRAFNTFCPTLLQPIKGDPKPFLDFMTMLIPDPADRHQTLRWIATLVARPAIKMSYALLLVSETQGVGKSTLFEKILAPLVGNHNVSRPNETTIVNDQFQEWAECKRLVILEEIYAGQSFKAANALKSKITEDTVTINKKYQSQYTLNNFLHFAACSNSYSAIRLQDRTDRRWLIPGVTENKQSADYFNKFYDWLEYQSGVEIIFNWANEFAAVPGHLVLKGEAPFITKTFMLTLDHQASEGESWLNDLMTSVKGEFNGHPHGFFDHDLRGALKSVFYEDRPPPRWESPQRVRKVASQSGIYMVAKEKIWDKRCNRKGHFIAPDLITANMTRDELESSNIAPINLTDFALKTKGM